MALVSRKNLINYSDIPLVALKHSTRNLLSQGLNGTKVIPSPSNLPRDWRGIAHIAGVPSPHINCSDPIAAILSLWEKQTSSFNDLIEALKEIDRWDIIDDTESFLEHDAIEYQRVDTSRHHSQEELDEESENILTLDDVHCIESCGQPQYYDAFLLFDDSDKEFALKILYKLENDYRLKLCTKDRDLIGGLPFEHEAIMQLLRDRCRRLIVVVSPTFLQSSANKFLLVFAQALGIEQGQRKIIPCIYSKFTLPLHLKFYFVLDFTRASGLWDFWDRLNLSIRAASPTPRSLPPTKSPEAIESAAKSIAVSKDTSNLVDKWECSKVAHISSVPASSAPSCEPAEQLTNAMKSSPDQNATVSHVDEQTKNTVGVHVEYPSSTSGSLSGHSESEPILRSSTSTTSLISKVFKPPRMKWFKKKKKVPVAV